MSKSRFEMEVDVGGTRHPGIEFKPESREAMMAREAASAPPPVIVNREDVADAVIVVDGLVAEIYIDYHGNRHVPNLHIVESIDDMVVGEPVPWPRVKRDRLLSETDWTQQPELKSYKSEEWIRRWADYRQALRDLPSLYPDPLSIVWPEKPIS